MDRREFFIGIGLVLFSGGLGTALTAAQVYPSHAGFFAVAGSGISLAGIVLAIWAFQSFKTPTKEDARMGDTYSNSGNNFGHMGPINIGRQQFVFNQQVGAELLRVVPKNEPVDIDVVGSERSASIGNQIIRFMQDNGYQIGRVTRIGMKIPPPSGPLSFYGNTLTIAADL